MEENNDNLNNINRETIKSNNSTNFNNEIEEDGVEIVNLSDDYQYYDLSFKIIVIGNSGVGKTCITNQATKLKFDDCYKATVGMEFYSLSVKLNKILIKLQIWDTCGQETYRSLITNFYRSSSLGVMVYAIDDLKSFNDLDFWMKEIKVNNSPDTKLILVGNKLDKNNDRKVKFEEGKNYAKSNGFEEFFETSAKTGENVRKMFIKVAKILYDDYKKYKELEMNDSFSSYAASTKSKKLNDKKKSKNQTNEKKNKSKNCC
jgi:Ras-related protein Rab-2A